MCNQGIPGEGLGRRSNHQAPEGEESASAGQPIVQKAGLPTSPSREVADVERELTALRDRYLRLAADFDNYKKRVAREHERRSAAQREAFVRDLLPVMDNLERSLFNATTHSPESLKLGVQMIWQQAVQVLNQHGFEPQEDLGQRFNPSFHEALAVRADTAFPDHAVLEVWQRGWRRGGALFRPAKVVVNDLASLKSVKPPPSEP